MANYQFFDQAISSDFELPGLPLSMSGQPSLHVRLAEQAVEPHCIRWIHRWADHEEGSLLQVGVLEHPEAPMDYVLSFEGIASFRLGSATVDCSPEATCTEHDLVHLLLDQVLPRVWARRGQLVIHGAGLVLPNGHNIALLGDSGVGKSTLAAALQGRGAQLLSDDCLQLTGNGSSVLAVPSYPALRLWPDSADALGISNNLRRPVCRYSDKVACEQRSQTVSVALDGIYFLGEADVEVRSSLVGAIASIELIKSSFLLDVYDKRCAVKQLAHISAIHAAGTQLWRMDYPRSYSRLDAVCSVLMSAEQ